MSLFRRSRRAPASPGDVAVLELDLAFLRVPSDDTERRRQMELYRDVPTPEAGYRFWKLAMPDIEAAFWACRALNRAGSTP